MARHPDSKINWKARVAESLGADFEVGNNIGNEAWEIWKGLSYVGLLVRDKVQSGKWYMTHNGIGIGDGSRFESPLLATQAYLTRNPL